MLAHDLNLVDARVNTLGAVWLPSIALVYVVLKGLPGARELWRDVRAAPVLPMTAVLAGLAQLVLDTALYVGLTEAS